MLYPHMNLSHLLFLTIEKKSCHLIELQIHLSGESQCKIFLRQVLAVVIGSSVRLIRPPPYGRLPYYCSDPDVAGGLHYGYDPIIHVSRLSRGGRHITVYLCRVILKITI